MIPIVCGWIGISGSSFRGKTPAREKPTTGQRLIKNGRRMARSQEAAQWQSHSPRNEGGGNVICKTVKIFRGVILLTKIFFSMQLNLSLFKRKRRHVIPAKFQTTNRFRILELRKHDCANHYVMPSLVWTKTVNAVTTSNGQPPPCLQLFVW